jgi:hypothetical protein
MKKYFYIILFSFISNNFNVQSQEIKIISESAYAEKIYVQLSSNVYTTDNTIWFKAIVTDLMHLPTRMSGVLHVELVDFDKRIVDQKLLKIIKGTANGFFDLKRKMPAGRYQLRAYTEWNKNFGNAFISENYIDVYSSKKVLENEEAIRSVTLTETAPDQFELSAKAFPRVLNPKYIGKLKMYVHTESKTDSVEVKRGDDNAYSFKYTLPQDAVKARIELKLDEAKVRNGNREFISSFSKTIAVNKDFIDLQFFPEGGKLVDGLTSKIAFKALDYKNNGTLVMGNIVDKENNIVMPFKSNKLGMGITYLTSDIRNEYYAKLKGKGGTIYKYKMPQVYKSGVVLNVKEQKEFIILTLKTRDLIGEQFSIRVESRGVEKDNFYMEFKEAIAATAIEKRVLPEGLIKVTVSNKLDQIVCERLFFNYKEEERVEVKVIPRLKQYKQRDKTIVSLNTKSKDSSTVKTNISVLVVDKSQLGSVNKPSTLLSYFLLNSELQGEIEQPTSYFDVKNKRRKHEMDALLLTQGWSNYKYEGSESKADFKFLPEKNLTVSGYVRNLVNTKKQLRKPIDLTLMYGPLNVMMQPIDSLGRFHFFLEDYYKDEFKVMIQSKSKKGKKKDFIIDLNSYKIPKVNYLKQIRIEEADILNPYLKQSLARKKEVESFNTSKGTVALDEVQLTGYALTDAREKMMKRYGPPDVVVENKELRSKEENWHSGLYSLLQSSYPNDLEVYPVYPKEGGDYLKARIFGAKRTIVLVDGIPVKRFQYSFLDALPIEEIKSFEIIKRPKRTEYFMGKALSPGFDVGENDALTEGAAYAGNEASNGNELETEEEARLELEEEPVLDAKSLIGRTSVICIYTYAGKGFNFVHRPKGIYRGVVHGFASKREFYAPKYDDTSSRDWSEPDFRSVIHWNPNVTTDSNGDAQIEFYNGDNIGEILIIVEGITKNGKLGYSETTYTVEKKE